MAKQIIDFNWDKLKPKFVARDLENDQVEQIELLAQTINWQILAQRFCPGVYSTLEKCPDNVDLTGTKYERCRVCENKIGFPRAFFFTQDIELMNPEVRKFLSKQHYIYLAYFAPDIIKVGTAAESRLPIRLYEQDATAYTLLAKSTGFEIQALERYISKNFSLPEHV